MAPLSSKSAELSAHLGDPHTHVSQKLTTVYEKAGKISLANSSAMSGMMKLRKK